MQQVNVAAGQVAVEVAEQPGDVGHEGLAVVLGAHRLDFVQPDAGRAQPQHVGALDGAAHPALGHHHQDPGVDQARHVPVQAGRRHVGQLFAQAGRGQRAVAEKRLHDPQADRVQQQISRGHSSHRST